MIIKVLLRRSLWRMFFFVVYIMLGFWFFCYVERILVMYKEMLVNMFDEL